MPDNLGCKSVNPFPQEETLKKLNVTRLAVVIGTLASLAGCAIVPSDPAVLSQMSGSYSVVDQFSYPNTHSTRIDIKFLPVDEHGKTSALVKMYDGDKLRLYRLDDCGYPGDNAARRLSNSDNLHASEVVLCRNSRYLQDRSLPQVIFIHSLDGHQLVFHPDGGLVSAIVSKNLVSNEKWEAIVDWAPVWSSGFMLRKLDQ